MSDPFDIDSVCAWCGEEENESFSRCSRCKKAKYCGRKCQKAHYKMHREDCMSAYLRRQIQEKEEMRRKEQIEVIQAERGDVQEYLPRLPPPFSVYTCVPSPDKDHKNILIMLHGYGDNDIEYSKFALAARIPNTLCVALRAPWPLVDLGWMWYPEHDPTTGRELSEDDDLLMEKREEMTMHVCRLIKHIIGDDSNILSMKNNVKSKNVFLLGFSQGGTLALNCARYLDEYELGGIISICGAPYVPKEKEKALNGSGSSNSIPILITHGHEDTIVPPSRVQSLVDAFADHFNCSSIELKLFNKKHEMINSQEEMKAVLGFLAGHIERSESDASAPKLKLSEESGWIDVTEHSELVNEYKTQTHHRI